MSAAPRRRRLRLHGLGPPDLGTVEGHHGVVRHVLRLERRHADALPGQPAADAGGEKALAGVGAVPATSSDPFIGRRTMESAGGCMRGGVRRRSGPAGRRHRHYGLADSRRYGQSGVCARRMNIEASIGYPRPGPVDGRSVLAPGSMLPLAFQPVRAVACREFASR